MMMRWERALGALGGSVLVAAGAIELAACSEGGTGFPTKHDATANFVDTGVDAGTDDDSGSADAGADAPVDCGTPLTLQPSPDAGAFCPFMAGGAKRNCAVSEHCCVYPVVTPNVPSTCNAAGSPCDALVDAGGADFECDEKADCVDPGKPTCCLQGTATVNTACSTGFVSGIKRTYCSADPACGGGQTICGASGECGDGGTCAPVSTKSKTIGVCVR
ncbi:hypothetical protein LZC95_12235 [Pendulispora brunnea]|uniref:Tryptophan synthase alpha chain n=1 Tax=Pendulispora brunnea TaxID=2905690 RepID=A0ABZ2KJ38_9BACT